MKTFQRPCGETKGCHLCQMQLRERTRGVVCPLKDLIEGDVIYLTMGFYIFSTVAFPSLRPLHCYSDLLIGSNQVLLCVKTIPPTHHSRSGIICFHYEIRLINRGLLSCLLQSRQQNTSSISEIDSAFLESISWYGTV